MKKLLLIVLGLVCFGCEETTAESQRRTSNHVINLAEELEYYKDMRTGACFAGLWVGANYGTLASTPCTPEVEKVAHQFISRR